MSWKAAQAEADRIYADVRARHPAGFVRMVIRALERKLNREEKARASPPQPDTSSQDIKK